MSIFGKQAGPKPELQRNVFDGSFQNNLTMQMGYLYPCYVQEVLPGDTFEINTAFGLRMMPMAFPIQTKLRADVHYFYVRNRNLWSGWTNFIGQTGKPGLFPILSLANKQSHFKTGSLGDYLGLPSTIVGRNSQHLAIPKQHSKQSFSFYAHVV